MGEPAARGNWSNWLEFLFSTIGCLVGLGNVWSFPYVCYRNGGGAFLIPYLVAMMVCGVPIFFLEMAMCQFSNLGPGRVWVICPLFRGIGYGMVVLTSVVSLYYNVIIAWVLYYMVMAFRDPLPWASCDNWWNSNTCIPIRIHQETLDWASAANVTAVTFSNDSGTVTSDWTVTSMMSAPGTADTVTGWSLKGESSAEEFWGRHVLQDEGHDISNVGQICWQLMLCLLGAWLFVFLCLFKDIKTSGKVVYVAAVLPYVVLTALLVRGCMLPGAVDGLRFYLLPHWYCLSDTKVWLTASIQVFYSVGIGWGGVSTLASFNRFHNNVYRDALLLPALDTLTSVFAGLVTFVYLGYMAHTQGTTVDQVVTHGPGLAFIAYPDALATMPLPQLWAVLFFLVLFTVGLGSQFVHVQTITSAIVDIFPRQLRHRKRGVTMTVCIVGFLLGLPFVTQGGQDVMMLCDWYVASVSLMLMAVGETLVVSWVYGSKRLCEDIKLMIGYTPHPVWHVFWKLISPGFVLTIWEMDMEGWQPPSGYPGWAIRVGWVIAVLPLLPIPVFAVVQLLSSSGNLKERVVASIQPSSDWRPAIQLDDQEEMQEFTFEQTHADTRANNSSHFNGTSV